METEIIVAIIGASAAIVTALIAGIFSVLKKDNANGIKVKQKQQGNQNTQIGIQNNYGDKKDD